MRQKGVRVRRGGRDLYLRGGFDTGGLDRPRAREPADSEHEHDTKHENANDKGEQRVRTARAKRARGDARYLGHVRLEARR